MIPDNFEKFKESETFVVYLEKDRQNKKQIKMIVLNKKSNLYVTYLLTDAVFKLFFAPEEYKKVYMNQGSGSR